WVQPQHKDISTVPVQVTGDASLLYRYINPNILLTITESSESNMDQEIVGKVYTLLTVYIIDLIKGSIIFSEILPKGAASPILLAACDHFSVIHYWNELNHRFEIHSIELFHTAKDEGPLKLIINSRRKEKIFESSFDLPSPYALTSTHIFPSAISTIGITATRQGISPRNILFEEEEREEEEEEEEEREEEEEEEGEEEEEEEREEEEEEEREEEEEEGEEEEEEEILYKCLNGLTSNQVYSLPRKFINARNPKLMPEYQKKAPKMNSTDVAEGLLPYTPLLPLSTENVISNFRQVHQIKGIVSHPSSLESTSLIFSYGLDLFFSTAEPAMGYDKTPLDFSYILAIVAVVASVVGFFYSHRQIKKKAIHRMWK
ncbi:hypothetical protein IE077_000564, partial [Cardiosporidium cionae]